MPAEAIDLGDLPAHGSGTDDGGFEDEHRRRLRNRAQPAEPALAASVPPMSRRSCSSGGVHVAVLWALAVAQPAVRPARTQPGVLRHARLASPGEIVAFALLVTFAAPLALLAAEWLAGLVERGGRLGACTSCSSRSLVAAIALQAISLAGTVPALALASALGAAAAVAYVRLPAARTLLTVLGPAPLVFVALFLLVSDVSDLVFPASADVQAAHVRATAPVVLVIFDEFPVHSLMGADGRVDKRLYPNFARLARDATWYRDTASVDQDTPYAVPAILDGRLPRQDRLPVAADHPRNVFSLFGGRLRAARERGRDRAVRADPVQGLATRAGFSGRCARCGTTSAWSTRTSCCPTTSSDELPRSRTWATSTAARHGSASPTRAGQARDQAPPLRAHPRQPRPRPPRALRGVRRRHRGRAGRRGCT